MRRFVQPRNRNRVPWGSFLVVAVLLAQGFPVDTLCGEDAISPLAIGATLPEFSLQDPLGKSYSPSDFDGQKVLVVYFFGTECPIAKLQSVQLQQAWSAHAEKGIALVGIDSNQQDSLRDLEAYAKQNELTFPLLKDPGNRIADAFGARRTPEVFVFGPDRKLVYRGAIDDQYTYGLQRPRSDRQYLNLAVRAVLAGEEVQTPVTEPVGCLIGRKREPQPGSSVTFSNQIIRLLQDNCVRCHREGEVAPMELTDYEEVAGWAEMIREVVNERRMPPWHADPAHGQFANDPRLSDDQIALINQWVAAGAPAGDPADLPPPAQFVEGWRIGEPDVVVEMSDRPFRVKATGEVPYQYFSVDLAAVDPRFKEDTWVKAAECRIGNRAVVHHIIVAAEPPKESRGQKHEKFVRSEWITAIAPGSPPLQLPDGYAKLIPGGSKLIFQMHYTPIGTPQEDLSKVGFIFADPDEVRRVVGTRQAVNEKIKIPAGAANHPEYSEFTFPRDGLLLSLFPHMHLRGKSFRYEAFYPDGSSEILLEIPRYDFNWQNGYKLDPAKPIPRGTRIVCTAHFDNSADNLANPDPTKVVRWGDQTWEEMMIGYLDIAWAEQDLQRGRDSGAPAATEAK